MFMKLPKRGGKNSSGRPRRRFPTEHVALFMKLLKQCFKALRNAKAIKGATDMKDQTEKVYAHYDHQDECRAFRWTARESYEYLYDRPWEEVLKFYSYLTTGRLSLSSLVFNEDKKELSVESSRQTTLDSLRVHVHLENNKEDAKIGKWARRTFKIHLSYDGSSFDGWQKQPGLNTVQGLVEKTLGEFVDERKAQEMEAKNGSVEATVSVAGRTDKGVSAFQQVCSFYTWRTDISPEEVERKICAAAPGQLRVVSVSEVSREFHPNFSAKWRRYLYVLPLNDGEGDKMFQSDVNLGDNGEDNLAYRSDNQRMDTEGINLGLSDASDRKLQAFKKPCNFNVDNVNQLLQQLEGKSLSYAIFARDTKASRSSGPATDCFMYHARAATATLPQLEQDKSSRGRNVMCVELVANRFLRKMVRVLVATAVREAAAGAAPDILLKLMEATCRRASAPPAPPAGLCLVNVGYEDINMENFLIK
ncbi:uncharacterized protein LOC131053710 isoform X2 [Cryptomeria japonica]|uniref:uncharacterized protein LOC131053710 isoform X2 n=1 Tax=Cryptomeria japonica TaxID=3369 RepID=UPI0025ABF385|nr:uncharacterized protein LOC131053710 isoform X2 [Cryptomeria japonica]